MRSTERRESAVVIEVASQRCVPSTPVPANAHREPGAYTTLHRHQHNASVSSGRTQAIMVTAQTTTAVSGPVPGWDSVPVFLVVWQVSGRCASLWTMSNGEWMSEQWREQEGKTGGKNRRERAATCTTLINKTSSAGASAMGQELLVGREFRF